MPELGEEMNEHFRGVLTEVMDGQSWAGYAGPAASVRRRGERRRRRLVVLSATGVAAAVVAVATGAGLAVGGSSGSRSPAPGPAGGKTSSTAGSGRYVLLPSGMLHVDDPGAGFTTGLPHKLVQPELNSGLCRQSWAAVPLGTPVEQTYQGLDPAGDQVELGESLYQFSGAEVAKQIFEAIRSSAQQGGGCPASQGVQVEVVPSVGDGMYIVRQEVAPSLFTWRAFVVDGGIVISLHVETRAGKSPQSLPSGWLTGLMQKAVARLRSAPRTDTSPGWSQPTRQQTPDPPTTPTHEPIVATKPVDGYLLAPADLGAGFTADRGDQWNGKDTMPTATSVNGIIYRGTLSGGDGEFIVNEGVYRFTDAAAAQAGFSTLDQAASKAQPLAGLGDQAWIRHFDHQQGGVTVAIRSGDKVITLDVLAGGASADQPIPGGDAWVQQIAHTALQRLAAAK